MYQISYTVYHDAGNKNSTVGITFPPSPNLTLADIRDLRKQLGEVEALLTPFPVRDKR